MKKAKIMLSAIVVLAVVGGGLAFKAKSGHSLYYKTQILGQPLPSCVVSFDITTVNNSLPTVPVPTAATGWYTTDACDAATFVAFTDPN